MNDVTTTTKNDMMTVGDRMAATGVDAKDLAIPRLLLMQSTSEMVGQEQAKVCDIVNSQTLEILGDVQNPIEIVPLSLYKTLVTEDCSGTKPKFLRQEPLTSENERLPWEDQEDGKPIKRTTCFNFFCLLSKEVESDEAFPVVVRFKSTSMQTGKQLATHLFKMAALDKESYSKAVTLGVRKDKKDTNFFAVFTLGKTRPSTEQEVASAQLWAPSLDAMKQKVNAIVEGTADESSEGVKATVVTGSAADSARF